MSRKLIYEACTTIIDTNCHGFPFQNHCAVGEVYFALDPRTGITSQDEHDPWKWAQETAKKMDSSDDSCLVFIGAPSPAMGICIYKDLPNNQAFVSTAYLKKMVTNTFPRSFEKLKLVTFNFVLCSRSTRTAWPS